MGRTGWTFLVLLAVLGLAIAALPAATWAESPEADVAIEPDGELTVGDPVALRIIVSHEPGDRVLFDGAVVQMGGMEPAAPVISELTETETLVVFQTRAFATGRFEVQLPPIPIQRADGSLTAVSPQPVALLVASVLDGETEPRPLTAPNLLGGDRRTFTPWIVAIIGIGAGFVLARVISRRYRRPAETSIRETTAAALTPRATFEIDASLEPAEQCRQLATSIRSRLSDDWSLPASALTASEIGPALAAAGAPGAVVLRVTQLLEACDRAQFGGDLPTPERLQGYAQLAEAIWSNGDEQPHA